MVLSNFQEVSFIVVCDVTAEPRELVKHLEDSQVDIKDAVNFSDMLNICSLDNTYIVRNKGENRKDSCFADSDPSGFDSDIITWIRIRPLDFTDNCSQKVREVINIGAGGCFCLNFN